MQHGADAAEFLAAARASRPAVHSVWQRCAVSGGFVGVITIEYQQPAVPRRQAEQGLLNEVRVVADYRSGETARTSRGQFHGMRGGVVREESADRSERLDLVWGLGVGVGAAQQQWRQESASTRIGVDEVEPVRIAVYKFAFRAQPRERGAPRHAGAD